MKVVSLNKMDNFHKVDFEVFRWNLENAAKVPDDIRWRHCASGVWSCLVAKGWLLLCANLVKGFIRVLWRSFRGDDLGWPRFDRCLTGLTWLIGSLVLMTVIKNLGHHSLPPLRRISSRDSKFQGQDRETRKWSSQIFWNYSEGATRWGYWSESITTIGPRLAHKSNQRWQIMESLHGVYLRMQEKSMER
jgi:hypothetical protein